MLASRPPGIPHTDGLGGWYYRGKVAVNPRWPLPDTRRWDGEKKKKRVVTVRGKREE